MVAVWLLAICHAVAVNVAVVLPDRTVTEAGTVNRNELLDRDTIAPAEFDTVTVHLALAEDARLAGLHVNPLTNTDASEIAAVCVLPFSAAVSVAVWLAVIVPAVAVNVAVVLPDATVTEAGTVNAAVLLDRVTVAPAALDTVTVHVALADDARLAGLQVNPLGTTGATSEIVGRLRTSVQRRREGRCLAAAIIPAVAVNVAVVLPEATATEAGTVNAAALLDSVTVAPAVLDTVTVQVALRARPQTRRVARQPAHQYRRQSEIVAVCVLPFNVAVSVAVWLPAIVPAVAVNVAVVLLEPQPSRPERSIAAALLDRVTVAPPALDTDAVQVALALDPRLVGLHVNPVSNTGAISEIVAVCVLPFSVAVRSLSGCGDRPGRGRERRCRAPEPTAIETGTVNAAALLDSVTVAPAALDTVTVQVALPPDPRLVGLHVSPLTNTGAAREIVAVCVLPFNVAVRVAVWLLAIVPAVAVNVAVVLARRHSHRGRNGQCRRAAR